MHVVIVTAQNKLMDKECHSVVLPTATGQIEVLSHHTSLLTKLIRGTIRIKQSEQETGEPVAIHAGLAQVKNNQINILAETN